MDTCFAMDSNTTPQQFSFYKILPLLILLISLALFFYFRLYQYLTFAALQQHRNFLHQWTSQHSVLAPLIFMGTYIIAVAISIPSATIITLLGGFLFGIVFGTLYVVISATIGAISIFLAARSAFHALFFAKAKPWLEKMEKGFQKNALQYLLFLRLVPLFPFWLVNIVPALLNVRLRTYIIATFLGIIPGVLIYVSVGNGLDTLFQSGHSPDLGIIFKPAILLPLFGLAILSLIPVIYRKWKETHYEANS